MIDKENYVNLIVSKTNCCISMFETMSSHKFEFLVDSTAITSYCEISTGGPASECPFSAFPFAITGSGIFHGPPGDSGSLAVNISTPSAVTSSVCSV